MELPSFQEFIDSLDKETISGIMKDANNAAKLVLGTPVSDPQDLPGLQIQSVAFQISLELLAVYHKWLEQHD